MNKRKTQSRHLHWLYQEQHVTCHTSLSDHFLPNPPMKHSLRFPCFDPVRYQRMRSLCNLEIVKVSHNQIHNLNRMLPVSDIGYCCWNRERSLLEATAALKNRKRETWKWWGWKKLLLVSNIFFPPSLGYRCKFLSKAVRIVYSIF